LDVLQLEEQLKEAADKDSLKDCLIKTKTKLTFYGLKCLDTPAQVTRPTAKNCFYSCSL
jgi:hypothetical protein